MNMRKLYYQIPMPIKRLALAMIPYPAVAGKKYRETLRLCQYLDQAAGDDIAFFQEQQLKKILTYAVNKVAFYKPYRCKLDNVRSYREALKHFPIIDKKTVQERFEEFISDDIADIRYLKARTGGSSGNQLLFYQDRAIYGIEMAFMHSLWKRVGYSPACRKATFRGVTFDKLKANEYWQYNPIHNELQFSPFHISEDNLGLYLEKMLKYRPEFLHGYPSALTNLAQYIISHELQSQLPELQAVLCCSEECTAIQRQRMEQAFSCRVYSWYGHSERVVLAGECEKTQAYHALPGYGICEIIKPDGQPCSPGECGEITGTGFWNFSMPLIRYNTEDSARFLGNSCSCRRNNVIFDQVESRWKSGILSKSNVLISAAALNVHEEVFDRVRNFQYYQPQPGSLEILVVPADNWSDGDAEKILALHRSKLKDELDIKIVITDHIPLTKAGKQLVIRLGYKPEGI